jgi:hypothetical protein
MSATLAFDRAASARRQFLLAALHLERVGFGHLECGASPLHLRRLRRHLLAPRTGQHQPFPLPGRLQRGVGALRTGPVLVELRCRNVVVLVQRLGALPILTGAVGLRLRGIHGGFGVEPLLRTRAVAQLGQPRLAPAELGLPLPDIRRQRLLLPFERRLRLRQLRLRGEHPGRLPLALRRELIPVQARDDLPLLHRIAFVYGSLDQPSGGLERNVHLRQLDIPGDDDPVGGAAPRGTISIDSRRCGRKEDNDDDDSLLHFRMLPTLPIACARSTRATLYS